MWKSIDIRDIIKIDEFYDKLVLNTDMIEFKGKYHQFLCEYSIRWYW